MTESQQGPGFVPPSGPQQGWPPSEQPAQPPQQQWTPGQGAWPPPDGSQQDPWAQQPGGWPAQQPDSPANPAWPVATQPAPARPSRRRRWPAVVAVVAIAALAVAAVFLVPAALTQPAIGPIGSSTAGPVVTVMPSPQPGEKTVLTKGADLGAAASFTTATGTGTLTIEEADWTKAGRMAPPTGKLYLVLQVTIACTSGTVDASSLSLRTTGDPADQSAFGPELGDQFPGVRLKSGGTQSGQVGFVLPAGEVTIALLDPSTLLPVATRTVPGP